MHKLLLVEDNLGLREQMKWALNDTFEILETETLQGAVELYLAEKPALVCLDLGLENKPDRGIEILDALLGKDRLAKVVVVTSNTHMELGRKAVEHGAFDYLQKPVDVDELKVILSRALRLSTLEAPAEPEGELPAGLPSEKDFFMVGRSEPMLQIFDNIKRLAPNDVTVLITGESGTGKELCARAIHFHGKRRNNVFAPINCGSIPATLMESELFGYVRGAFTGANSDKMGLIESAHKGTLFLDEIGEMPLALQVKLLRFLEDRKLQRLGSTQFKDIDVRVIAATNRLDLADRKGNTMREDLYYRLSEFEIRLPPLRERPDDILLIADGIVENCRKKFSQPKLKLSKRAERHLQTYTWPGNVRELENKLSRAALTCKNQTIEAEDLGLSETQFTILSYREARIMFDRNFMLNALKQSKGNVSFAAKASGLSRPTFYDMMKKAGIILHFEAKVDEEDLEEKD